MKLETERKRALIDFFVNLASAWAIAGVVTPWFIKSSISQTFVFDIMMTIGNIFVCFYIIWKVTKK